MESVVCDSEEPMSRSKLQAFLGISKSSRRVGREGHHGGTPRLLRPVLRNLCARVCGGSHLRSTPIPQGPLAHPGPTATHAPGAASCSRLAGSGRWGGCGELQRGGLIAGRGWGCWSDPWELPLWSCWACPRQSGPACMEMRPPRSPWGSRFARAVSLVPVTSSVSDENLLCAALSP